MLTRRTRSRRPRESCPISGPVRVPHTLPPSFWRPEEIKARTLSGGGKRFFYFLVFQRRASQRGSPGDFLQTKGENKTTLNYFKPKKDSLKRGSGSWELELAPRQDITCRDSLFIYGIGEAQSIQNLRFTSSHLWLWRLSPLPSKPAPCSFCS